MTLSWWQDIERRAASLKGSLGISQASAKGRWQIDFSPSTLRPPGAQNVDYDPAQLADKIRKAQEMEE